MTRVRFPADAILFLILYIYSDLFVARENTIINYMYRRMVCIRKRCIVIHYLKNYFKKNQNSRLGSSLKVFIQQQRTALIQQDCELCIFAMGWNNKKNWSSKYRDGVIFQFLYHTIYRIGQMWVHFYVIFLFTLVTHKTSTQGKTFIIHKKWIKNKI